MFQVIVTSLLTLRLPSDFTKSARLSLKHSTSLVAVTVAVRGSSLSSAISPTYSPMMMNMMMMMIVATQPGRARTRTFTPAAHGHRGATHRAGARKTVQRVARALSELLDDALAASLVRDLNLTSP